MKTQCLLAVAWLAAATAWGADYHPLDIKTGQWENTMKSQTSGAPPVPAELLERLTPEQRAKMEAAMKARAAQGPRTTVTKSCITKDQLAKPLELGEEQEKSCTRTLITSTSSRQEITFTCLIAGIKSTGTMHIDAVDSGNIKAHMTMNMTSSSGTSTNNLDFTARWLGPICTEKDGK